MCSPRLALAISELANSAAEPTWCDSGQCQQQLFAQRDGGRCCAQVIVFVFRVLSLLIIIELIDSFVCCSLMIHGNVFQVIIERS